MQIGDIVKISHDGFLKEELRWVREDDLGVGIIIKFENTRAMDPDNITPDIRDIVVMWPTRGISWCDPEQLEILNESN